MTPHLNTDLLMKEVEELDAEIFLIEETILLSPLGEEDERKLRSQLAEKRMQQANIRMYLSQLNPLQTGEHI